MSDAKRVPNRLLRHERNERHWTQSYVAQKVNTDAFTVSRWETGTTFPNPEHRLRLCELFQMSMAELGLVSPAIDARRTGPKVKTAEITPKPLYDPAIPHVLHALVGRENILTSFKHLLIEQQSTATFALQGMPGVGKTALAVALSADVEVRAAFPGGILWAGLGTQPNIAHLLSRWSQLLGMSTSSMQKFTNVEEVGKAIRSAIGTRRLLLVIDDAWTVEDAFAFHVGGPNCVYLLTTRHTDVALHCAGHISTIDELDEDNGVALLVRLAPASRQVPHDLRRLVRAVGGLPLALTLMGRYVHAETYKKHIRRLAQAIEKLLSVEERLRLTQPVDPTEGISSVVGTTTYSLQAVIAVSNLHLTQEAQSTLRALAIFPPKPNMFHEAAALATAAITSTILDELTDAGLVESQGQGYYTLHQVIADYARTTDDRVTSVRNAVEERMVLFYVHLIQAQSQHPEVLERDSQNILAAFEIAQKRSMFTSLLTGINAFAPFWIVRGQHQLAIHHLRTAQQIAMQQDDPRNVALTWIHLGRIAALHGNLSQADAYYSTGLDIARQSGDPITICTLLRYWCELMLNRGEHKRATQYIKESWYLARKLQDKRSSASALRGLGELANIRGDYKRSVAYYEKGLRFAHECNDDDIMSMLLQNLGSQASRRGDYPLARQYYAEGMQHARKTQNQQRISAILMNQGFLAFLQKDYKQAEKLSLESLELAQAGNNCIRIAWVLQNLGILDVAREQYASATRHFSQSYDMASEIEHAWITNETLCEWGELHLICEEWDAATEKFECAYQGAQSMEAAELTAMALFGLARANAGYQDYKKARELGRESHTLYTKMGHPCGKVVKGWLETVKKS